MAAGKHTSRRVALAVPPRLYQQLEKWSEWEGRPVASLCMYLIEQSLRQAQKDGIAPSFATEGDDDSIDRYAGREFNGYRTVASKRGEDGKLRPHPALNEKATEEKSSRANELRSSTKEQLLAKLVAALAD